MESRVAIVLLSLGYPHTSQNLQMGCVRSTAMRISGNSVECVGDINIQDHDNNNLVGRYA